MKAKGTKLERETIICFNEGEDTATVYTASQVEYRRLLKLGYEPVSDFGDGVEFIIPRSEVRPPKKKRILSKSAQEAKEKSLEKARASKKNRKSNKKKGNEENE